MVVVRHIVGGILLGFAFFGGLRQLLIVFMHHGYADPIAMLLALAAGIVAGVWTSAMPFVIAGAFGLGLLGVVLRFFFGSRGGWGT